MKQFSHILAATDFSGPAHHAVQRAAKASRETGAALTLLHVIQPPPLEIVRQLWSESATLSENEALDAARKKIVDLAATLSERHQVSAGTRIVSGSFLSDLSTEADAAAADLVVCGDSGEDAVQHLLLGSTVERIIGNVRRPVLVVKRQAHERYRSVLVAVDFSPASLRSITQARALAPDAEFVLLHAFEAPFAEKLKNAEVDENALKHYRASARKEAAKRLHALSDEAGLPTETTRFSVLQGDPLRRILEHEQRHNVDLIVLGKRGQSLLEALMIGSVTRRIVARSRCDVLVSV